MREEEASGLYSDCAEFKFVNKTPQNQCRQQLCKKQSLHSASTQMPETHARYGAAQYPSNSALSPQGSQILQGHAFVGNQYQEGFQQSYPEQDYHTPAREPQAVREHMKPLQAAHSQEEQQQPMSHMTHMAGLSESNQDAEAFAESEDPDQFLAGLADDLSAPIHTQEVSTLLLVLPLTPRLDETN